MYIGPNDSGTGHQVFKLATKKLVTTPKCKPVPMPDNVIKVVNVMGKQDKMKNRIQFHNIHHESTLSDLYSDKDFNADSSCASDADWDLDKKPEEDLKKTTFDDHIDDDEVKDLNIDNKDIPYVNDGGDLSRNIGVQHKHEGQYNHFCGPVVDKHQPNHHL